MKDLIRREKMRKHVFIYIILLFSCRAHYAVKHYYSNAHLKSDNYRIRKIETLKYDKNKYYIFLVKSGTYGSLNHGNLILFSNDSICHIYCDYDDETIKDYLKKKFKLTDSMDKNTIQGLFVDIKLKQLKHCRHFDNF